MKRARVLVVDDKGSFLALFRRILPADTEVACASDGARALELLATQRFDVVVTDVRMPGGADGIEVLKKVRASSDETAVILMTAYGSIAEAVRAMKYGADDYLTKPFDPDDAVAAIERAIERRRARSAAIGGDASHPLLGDSQRIVEARELVGRAARSDDNVFIYGETGTGKDVVASWNPPGRSSARAPVRRSPHPFVFGESPRGGPGTGGRRVAVHRRSLRATRRRAGAALAVARAASTARTSLSPRARASSRAAASTTRRQVVTRRPMRSSAGSLLRSASSFRRCA